MARTLADLLTPEEKTRFDELYRRGGITPTTAQVFAQRFADEIDDIAFRLEEHERVRAMPFSPLRARSPQALAEFLETQAADLADRRSRAFDTALDGSFGPRAWSQLKNLDRAIVTGYADERFREYLREQGPLGIGKDLAESLVTSVPRGVAATAETLGEGFGERPIERVGEMTGMLLPVRAGAGLASTIARGAGRPKLAQALGRVVSHPVSRGAAYTGETADIVGAEENVYSEALLEVLGEGVAEAGGAIGRGARDTPQATSEPEPDPIQQKQQQRAADNAAAAAAQQTENNAAKIQAALDIEALRLTQIAQQAAANKAEPTADDIAAIADADLVDIVEARMATTPEFQSIVEALTELGLPEAGDTLRARILDLHRQHREQTTASPPLRPLSPESPTTPTPEQTAAADLAGQPTTEIPPQETPDVQPDSTATPDVQEESGVTPRTPTTDTHGDTPSLATETQTLPLATDTSESVSQDWAGLDVELASEALTALEADPEANPSTVVDGLIDNLVNSRTLSAAEAYRLRPAVLSQIEGARRIGPETTAFWSDEDPDKPIQVRPVVRELDELIPSHDTDGKPREDFPAELELQPREGRETLTAVQKIREDARKFNPLSAVEFKRNLAYGPPVTSKRHPRALIAGTGRLSALDIIRKEYPEKWAEIQQALRTELEKLGMDPTVLDTMEAPVLTSELVSDLDEVALARDTNRDSRLGAGAAETAGQDAQYFDEELMALWEQPNPNFAESLNAPENADFRRVLFSRIPKEDQPPYLRAQKQAGGAQSVQFSTDGIKRIQNAMIRYVFGEDVGSQLANMFIETELEGERKAVSDMVRNALGPLTYAKARGADIGSPLAAAILRFIEIDGIAQRQNVPIHEGLWTQIEDIYQRELLPMPLLEKQLLYLVYAKATRRASAQFATIISNWATQSIAATSQANELFGETRDPVTVSEEIFATAIREHILGTVFGFDENAQTGAKTWHGVEKMPYELKPLRQALGAQPTADTQAALASEWIDGFLRMMNDGEPQAEITPEVPLDATQTTDATAIGGPPPTDTGTPQETGTGTGEGASPEQTPGTPGTPEGESEVAGVQPGGTGGAAVGTTQGTPGNLQPDTTGSGVDESEPLTLEAAVEAMSAGTFSVAGWNALSPQDKTTYLNRQEASIDVHLQTGAITEETAAQRREAIAYLRQQEIEDTEGIRSVPESTSGQSERMPIPQEGEKSPVDTNQVFGANRPVTPPDTAVPDVHSDPEVQRDLDAIGISVAEWERIKAEDRVEAFINSLSAAQQEQIDYGTNLIADMDADIDADIEVDWEEDEDLFSDIETDRLRDITDQQRADFEKVRQKLFLVPEIRRLTAKGADRTAVETALLRALQAPQRTTAQQRLYDKRLQTFIDRTVARLQGKSPLSTNEMRILDALQTVQAEGIPEAVDDRSLYVDLETPDQEHSRPLAETKTLAGVQPPDTAEMPVDLPASVTNDPTKLSPAQLTGIKAILAAFTRKLQTSPDTTEQGGFLLADKPGVGKTRQALAVMWNYIRQGIDRHFVLAPNTNLLNNYSKDMQALGGDANTISHYNLDNPHPNTPIGTATYTSLTHTPSLKNFATRAGNQNAAADIVEHLTGVRPTFQQTHPEAYQTELEAYRRILSAVKIPTLENVIRELRQQAGRVNLENAANVMQFRQRVTPILADLLLQERGQTGQQDIFSDATLEEHIQQLLDFARTHLAPQPDPNFAAAAEAYAGVIVLDEMHKVAGPTSQGGAMIATLDRLLPNAKFLYMSATPFKTIENFFVAERLGLWGENQPFPTFDRFRRTFGAAARAIKEIIPLHLKQIGRYLSRALSSKETRYTPVEVPLTETEAAQYDMATRLVHGIQQRYTAAIDAGLRTPWGQRLEAEDLHGAYRAHYMRMFYGDMQKFFLAVLDAMKAQGIASDIQAQLTAGDKVIVQLENTWDATTQRAEARGQTTAGPLDLLIDFVTNDKTFPVYQYETEMRTNRRGEPTVAIVPSQVYTDTGERQRVVDRRLKQLQTEALADLQTALEANPDLQTLRFAADILRERAAAAGFASGEISGRSDTDREALATAFSETTDVNLIVLGPAGLTGINLPVTEAIKDEVGGLYHYLLQSSWNVNTFEQGLGRGKRSNSAIDPQYIIVYQDVPGADRVLGATLAKFAEMGALAGQADSALMQNIDKAAGDISIADDDPEADVSAVLEETADGERSHVFGVHGQEALSQLWKDMYDAGEFQIADTLGLARPEIAGGTGFIDPETVPPVQQFFQRLLSQPVATQRQIYRQFEDRLKRIVGYRRELGTLDVGAQDLDSKDGRVLDRLPIYTDPDTGQSAEMLRVGVKRKLPRRSWHSQRRSYRAKKAIRSMGIGSQGYIPMQMTISGHSLRHLLQKRVARRNISDGGLGGPLCRVCMPVRIG